MMFSRIGPSLTRAILLAIGVYTLSWWAPPLAYAQDFVECTVPMKSSICMAGDQSCTTRAEPRRATLACDKSGHATGIMKSCLCMAGDEPCATRAEPEIPAAEHDNPEYEAGMKNETLSLYKTISYVTGATLMDQVWYLTIASEAAATGGVFFVVNAATSSMMTYNYEHFWNRCCRAQPGPDGIVPVSATKAIIYRALSVIRVGTLALLFGNTLPSAAIVTLAITLSRTVVYVTNDYVWNRVDVRKPANRGPVGDPAEILPPPQVESPGRLGGLGARPEKARSSHSGPPRLHPSLRMALGSLN
jgi:uncharacterized membrane protein